MNKPASFSQSYSLFLVPIFILAVIGVSAYTLTIPKMGEILNLRSKITIQEQQHEQLVKKRTLLQSVAREQVLETVKTINSALPGEKEPGRVISTIEGVAGFNQVVINGLSFTPGNVSSPSAQEESSVVETIGVPSYPVSVLVHGDRTLISQFLKNIQESRRLFDISSATLSFSNEDANAVDAELVLNTYYVAEITEIGGIEAPIIEITAEEQKLLSTVSQYPDITTLTTQAGAESPVGKLNLFAP